MVGGVNQYDFGDYLLAIDEVECISVATNTNCNASEPIDSIPATVQVDFNRVQGSWDYFSTGQCYLYSSWKRNWFGKSHTVVGLLPCLESHIHVYTALPIASQETCMQISSMHEETRFVVLNGTCSSLNCVSGSEEGYRSSAKYWRVLPEIQYCKLLQGGFFCGAVMTCTHCSFFFSVLAVATPNYVGFEIDFTLQVRLYFQRIEAGTRQNVLCDMFLLGIVLNIPISSSSRPYRALRTIPSKVLY